MPFGRIPERASSAPDGDRSESWQHGWISPRVGVKPFGQIGLRWNAALPPSLPSISSGTADSWRLTSAAPWAACRDLKGLFEPRIAQYNGRIFKLMGDGLLAEFASVVDAVECAAFLQQAVAASIDDAPAGQGIEARMAVNLGDVIIDGDDRHGEGVNIAARLEKLAEPGGLIVSRAVYDQVRSKVSLNFDDLGAVSLRNIVQPVQVYRVLPSEQTGRADILTVTTSPNFASKWLVHRLGDFAESHPEIDLGISASLHHMDFAREGVDVAIRHGEGQWPGSM